MITPLVPNLSVPLASGKFRVHPDGRIPAYESDADSVGRQKVALGCQPNDVCARQRGLACECRLRARGLALSFACASHCSFYLCTT